MFPCVRVVGKQTDGATKDESEPAKDCIFDASMRIGCRETTGEKPNDGAHIHALSAWYRASQELPQSICSSSEVGLREEGAGHFLKGC